MGDCHPFVEPTVPPIHPHTSPLNPASHGYSHCPNRLGSLHRRGRRARVPHTAVMGLDLGHTFVGSRPAASAVRSSRVLAAPFALTFVKQPRYLVGSWVHVAVQVVRLPRLPAHVGDAAVVAPSAPVCPPPIVVPTVPTVDLPQIPPFCYLRESNTKRC